MLLTRMFSRQPRHAGPQAADAAHHQIDLHAGAARRRTARSISSASTSEFSLTQIAAGRPALALAISASIRLVERGAQRHRREGDLLHLLGPGVAGHVVEQPRGVAAHRRIAGEERQVGVDARRDRVVVAGAEMHVGAHRLRLAPHHHRDLGVGLEVDEAIDHLHAGALRGRAPSGCWPPRRSAPCSSTSAVTDLARLGRLDQRLDDRANRGWCGRASA